MLAVSFGKHITHAISYQFTQMLIDMCRSVLHWCPAVQQSVSTLLHCARCAGLSNAVFPFQFDTCYTYIKILLLIVIFLNICLTSIHNRDISFGTFHGTESPPI